MYFGRWPWKRAGESFRFVYSKSLAAANLYVRCRWLGQNCSHMHDIARTHLLASGADVDESPSTFSEVVALAQVPRYRRHAQEVASYLDDLHECLSPS